MRTIIRNFVEFPGQWFHWAITHPVSAGIVGAFALGVAVYVRVIYRRHG